MRLINTTTLELGEFYGDIPHYTILSHRWEDGEVTFQDIQQGKGSSMQGWSKITGCCSQAKKDGWQWAWIDSCCIDKTSSAELSEAINSMFAWYKEADICYVYLSDVNFSLSPEIWQAEFIASKWFSRGWTLQELLAPRYIEFYTSTWDKIGTKLTLADMITKATGITCLHLFKYQDACTAQKFSWASKRKTTRLEDEAYCLMGLFDIHMPPLYGEGKKAFYRLQLEILKQSDDDSIFAWENHSFMVEEIGLLATAPSAFGNAGHVRIYLEDRNRPPITVTNKYLQLNVFFTGSSRADRDRFTMKHSRPGSPTWGQLPQPESTGIYRRSLYLVLNCRDYRRLSLQGELIRLPLSLPYPISLDLPNLGDNLSAAKGWSRLNKLDISPTTPATSSRDTRILLFAETTTIISHTVIHQKQPGILVIKSSEGFPFTITSAKSAAQLSNYWTPSHSTPGILKSSFALVPLNNTAVIFQTRQEHRLEPFALVVEGGHFSVYILPGINGTHMIESGQLTKHFTKNSGIAGDRTSQRLSDNLVLHAAHKKEMIGGSYAFVITLSLEDDCSG